MSPILLRVVKSQVMYDGYEFFFSISRKHCIESEGKFDFLKDLVANIADIANEEDEGESSDKPKKQ